MGFIEVEDHLRSIQEQWREFALATIPVDAPPIQRQEVRRAFYAGVCSALNNVGTLYKAGDLDAMCQWLNTRFDELRQFRQDLLDNKV